MILALLLGTVAAAAPLAEKWAYTLDQGRPVAAFFDASSKSILLSVDDEGKARVDQLDLGGKLIRRGVARAAGPAGALRAHFGRVFWIAGGSVWSFSPEVGGIAEAGKVPGECGRANDLALSREGNVLLGCESGRVMALGSAAPLPAAGKPVTGLFLLNSILYVLREQKLEAFDLSGREKVPELALCRERCAGIERRASGGWITANGKQLSEFGKRQRKLLSVTAPVGRIGFVYDREPENDLLLVPFPSEKTLRTFLLKP